MRVRRKLKGTPDRPRICICKSHRHLYIQVVDDMSLFPKGSKTLLQMTTNTKASKETGTKSFRTIEQAKQLGTKLAEALKELGITSCAFDRSGYKYHGVVKALAEAVREQGIKF